MLADEDGRARLASLEAESASRLDAARQARERRRAEVAAARQQALLDEIAAIERETAAQVEARRARRATWLAERERAAEALVERGVAAWIRIVRGGGTP